MTDLDLTRYEGHTPGHATLQELWSRAVGTPGYVKDDWITLQACMEATKRELLAEVRRLREALKVQTEMHNVCLEIHTESESCLEAEEKLTDLRQSHARLLAALLLVGRVEKRGGVPYYNTSGRTLIHQDQMREIGAAVEEAEAL